MPFTPYHFGPSGLLGLMFRRWLDLPVFVLANVVVDIEVLVIWRLRLGWPVHRYAHTFLLGAAVALAWALVAYMARPVFKWTMQLLRIPYETGFLKILISAVLGVWLHVLIDAIYHYDVKPFWPYRMNPLWQLLSHSQVLWICGLSFVAAFVLYLFAVRSFNRKRLPPPSDTTGNS